MGSPKNDLFWGAGGVGQESILLRMDHKNDILEASSKKKVRIKFCVYFRCMSFFLGVLGRGNKRMVTLKTKHLGTQNAGPPSDVGIQ